MDLTKNYYKILELENNADNDSIKKSFRTLSKKHHPDKGGSNESFTLINEAYDVLTNNKEQYDRNSKYGKNYQEFSQFDAFFNFHRRYNEILDISLTINVNLVDLYNTPTKTIKYNRNVLCSYCDATGYTDGDGDCTACYGRGSFYGGICGKCQGSGKNNTKKCTKCNGNKVVQKEEVITFKIYDPNTNKLYFEGMGNFSMYNRGYRGNLIIILSNIITNEYVIEGYDLIKTVPLDIKTAVIGGEIIFEHLQLDENGNRIKVRFNIPPKSKPNERYRLKNLGLASDKNGNIRGNLWVIPELTLDYDTLTDKDIELITKLELNGIKKRND